MTKLLEDVGTAFSLYQAQVLVNLPLQAHPVQIWAFCYSKEKNVAPADKGILGGIDYAMLYKVYGDGPLQSSWDRRYTRRNS